MNFDQLEENELVNLVSLLNVKLIDQAREFNLKENQLKATL